VMFALGAFAVVVGTGCWVGAGGALGGKIARAQEFAALAACLHTSQRQPVL
jgi:hypothetical protein